jgi:hypothetical protein
MYRLAHFLLNLKSGVAESLTVHTREVKGRKGKKREGTSTSNQHPDRHRRNAFTTITASELSQLQTARGCAASHRRSNFLLNLK